MMHGSRLILRRLAPAGRRIPWMSSAAAVGSGTTVRSDLLTTNHGSLQGAMVYSMSSAMIHTTMRGLATQSARQTPANKHNRGGNHSHNPKNNRKKPGSLQNEALVAYLARKSGTSKLSDIQVRMIRPVMIKSPATNGKASSDTSVVSLAECIQISIDTDTDILEVALDQPIPVVKVVNAQAERYRTSKATSATSNSNPAATEKEIRVGAGIAAPDLERKMNLVVGYLQKGHRCVIAVRCRRNDLQQDPQAATTTLDRVLAQVPSDVGQVARPPTYNATKTSARLFLRPVSAGGGSPKK